MFYSPILWGLARIGTHTSLPNTAEKALSGSTLNSAQLGCSWNWNWDNSWIPAWIVGPSTSHRSRQTSRKDRRGEGEIGQRGDKTGLGEGCNGGGDAAKRHRSCCAKSYPPFPTASPLLYFFELRSKGIHCRAEACRGVSGFKSPFSAEVFRSALLLAQTCACSLAGISSRRHVRGGSSPGFWHVPLPPRSSSPVTSLVHSLPQSIYALPPSCCCHWSEHIQRIMFHPSVGIDNPPGLVWSLWELASIARWLLKAVVKILRRPPGISSIASCQKKKYLQAKFQSKLATLTTTKLHPFSASLSKRK